MATTINIALAQENFLVGDIHGNTSKIITLSKQHRQSGVDLLVFPELAITGYPPEDLLMRQNFVRQIDESLKRLCDEISGIDVVVGAPRVTEDAMYNSAFWIREGQIIACYDKVELPNYAVFDEKRYFSPGDESGIVELKGHHFGLLICEDIWLSEPAKQAAEQGAETLIVINASPYHVGKTVQRIECLNQRVSETGCNILYLNMVGGQDELVFDGASIVVDRTNTITRFNPFEASCYLLQIQEQEIRVAGFADKTPDVEEANVYQALVLGVRDYVQKNGFSGGIVGLSGGVDSALTLAIAADALGADQVTAVLMPSRYTADMSNEDAIEEAELLGVEYKSIPIEKPFMAFLDTLQEPLLAGTQPDTTEENIQARCRGIILMAMSNKTGRLVLSTGNKSEMAVGYATLYGDMAGGFAPLKDISKMLVYKLCHYRNSLGRVIPERVLTRPPSAELAPDQVDQDSLPPYEVLDEIIRLSVEQDQPVEQIVAAGYDKATVERIINMIQRNEYKRRQAAPGVRITRRAFGRDRRYPITSGYRRKK